jgi:hypothetical protein
MFFGATTRIALALCFATQVLAGVSAFAVDDMPSKDAWKLRNGASFTGSAHDFGYQLCLLQRRMGKVYVNGAEVKNVGTQALLEQLAKHYSVPIDDPKALQKHLARQPYAQVVMPYFTLKYDAGGREQQVPVVLLADEDVALLRPAFNAWCQEKQREHEERVFRAQQLQNEQARLAMQAEELAVQRSIEQAAWNQAYAASQTADAANRGVMEMQQQGQTLKKIERNIRNR